MLSSDLFPLSLYGSSISYFTGKLEMYFRARGIPYVLKPRTEGAVANELMAQLGSTQMPAVQLADGRWMSDSTVIIQWLEREFPQNGLYPDNILQRFFSLLLEDYADEWLWRPAMHYRWYYSLGAHYAGQLLAEELVVDSLLPSAFHRWLIIQRQRRGYTRGDGIGQGSVEGVEAIYLDTLKQLQAILEKQNFILGSRPSLVDIGFSGPMFRHFGLDPVPAEIMRSRAPAVYAWLGRLWDYRESGDTQQYISNANEPVPAAWRGMLESVGESYLPYLNANVDAVAEGKSVFDATVDGVSYHRARSSKYRVWCLRRLREAYADLPDGEQAAARVIMEDCGIWQPLWEKPELPIDDATCSQLPFYVDTKMIDVYK